MALASNALTTENVVSVPQKKYFRQRAHANPLSDHSFLYPICSSKMNWHPFYPKYFDENGKSIDMEKVKKVEIVDVGCGYGGMLTALSPLFPDSLILGLEIRMKVSSFVHQRIQALRTNQNTHQNIAVLRTNAMKYMINLFGKGQLKKLFFLYPDPHFKKSKNKWRIISSSLLSEYAYLMAGGAIVYTITDVLEVHEWIKSHFLQHPLFVQLTPEEYSSDPIVPLLGESTEEGQKVTRNNGDKYKAIFKKIEDPLLSVL